MLEWYDCSTGSMLAVIMYDNERWNNNSIVLLSTFIEHKEHLVSVE